MATHSTSAATGFAKPLRMVHRHAAQRENWRPCGGERVEHALLDRVIGGGVPSKLAGSRQRDAGAPRKHAGSRRTHARGPRVHVGAVPAGRGTQGLSRAQTRWRCAAAVAAVAPSDTSTTGQTLLTGRRFWYVTPMRRSTAHRAVAHRQSHPPAPVFLPRRFGCRSEILDEVGIWNAIIPGQEKPAARDHHGRRL